MKQGEIWLVRYPEDGIGHEFFKERPALVIESDRQIERSTVFTVMAMTSNTKNFLQEDVHVAVDQRNRLNKDSIVKVHHIQTFDKSRFIKKIGDVSEEIMGKIKAYLKRHFEI